MVKDRLPDYEKWSDDHKNKFQKICGPLMKKLGFENWSIKFVDFPFFYSKNVYEEVINKQVRFLKKNKRYKINFSNWRYKYSRSVRY